MKPTDFSKYLTCFLSEYLPAQISVEPPCTERYARWCERSLNKIIIQLLLDSEYQI